MVVVELRIDALLAAFGIWEDLLHCLMRTLLCVAIGGRLRTDCSPSLQCKRAYGAGRSYGTLVRMHQAMGAHILRWPLGANTRSIVLLVV